MTGVDASDRFFEALAGVTEPERKRKIIGGLFIDAFTENAKAVDGAAWLAQGTLYPDVIESVSIHGPSAVIKTHHNVGGLPEKLGFKLVEPLRELFKDEVRRLGEELGIPRDMLYRHPFPGPGLAVRIPGRSRARRSGSSRRRTRSSWRSFALRATTTGRRRPSPSSSRSGRWE